MLFKMLKAFDSIRGLPRRIMLGGLIPSLILLGAAAALYLQPQISYSTFVLSRQMCRTAITLFSEGVVLGLFLDYIFSGNGKR